MSMINLLILLYGVQSIYHALDGMENQHVGPLHIITPEMVSCVVCLDLIQICVDNWIIDKYIQSTGQLGSKVNNLHTE